MGEQVPTQKKMVEDKKHTGVYAIILRGRNLLMIHKSRGPYKGMLDLPGGTPEKGESHEQALFRELEEEIGCLPGNVNFMTSLRVEFDYIGSDATESHFIHTGHYFMADIEPDPEIKTGADGHDSLGAVWVSLSDIDKGSVDVPAIVKKALSYLNSYSKEK